MTLQQLRTISHCSIPLLFVLITRLMCMQPDPSIQQSATLWIDAIINNKIHELHVLMQDKRALNRTYDQRTPLILAITLNRPDMVKLMLEAGADPNMLSEDGDLPLVSATLADSLSIVELLLRFGANPNMADSQGLTPLVVAVLKKNSILIEQLLGHKAKINIDTIGKGNTALTLATEKFPSIVPLLIRYSTLEPGAKNYYLRTAEIQSLTTPSLHYPAKSCSLTFTTHDHNKSIARIGIDWALRNTILVVAPVALYQHVSDFCKNILKTTKAHLFIESTGNLFIITPHMTTETINFVDTAQQTFGLKNLVHIPPERVDEELSVPFNSTLTSLLHAFDTIIDRHNPHHPTRFILQGHGGKTTIADVPIPESEAVMSTNPTATASRPSLDGYSVSQHLPWDPITALFTLLNSMGTEFLYIKTCNLGGINLLKIPTSNFPVVVQATTDYPVLDNPLLNILFTQVDSAIQEKKLLVPAQLSRILISCMPPEPNSLASVRFPTTGTAGFFRALDLGNMEILSELRLRQLKFIQKIQTNPRLSHLASTSQQKADSSDPLEDSPLLTIEKHIKYIQVFARDMRDLAIRIQDGAQPSFISKIPGTANHFIGALSYTSVLSDTHEAVKECIQRCFASIFYNDSPTEKPLTTKSWFIKKLVLTHGAGKDIIENLVVYMPSQDVRQQPAELAYMYRYKGEYHIYGQPWISYSQELEKRVAFEDFMYTWYNASEPSPEAVYEATAGYEILNTINTDEWIQ